MGTDEEILKNLKISGSSSSPTLTTPCLTDELDWSLNLNDFECNLIRDFISDGSSPDDEALAVFPVTNDEFSDISTVPPQHQSKSPENSTNFPGMDTDLPEVVSGGKDGGAATLDKDGFPGRRYRGVREHYGGRFSAKITLRSPGKKGWKSLWLGTYNTAEEAAMAFDQAAFKYRRSGAVLNFPPLVGTT